MSSGPMDVGDRVQHLQQQCEILMETAQPGCRVEDLGSPAVTEAVRILCREGLAEDLADREIEFQGAPMTVPRVIQQVVAATLDQMHRVRAHGEVLVLLWDAIDQDAYLQALEGLDRSAPLALNKVATVWSLMYRLCMNDRLSASSLDRLRAVVQDIPAACMEGCTGRVRRVILALRAYFDEPVGEETLDNNHVVSSPYYQQKVIDEVQRRMRLAGEAELSPRVRGFCRDTLLNAQLCHGSERPGPVFVIIRDSSLNRTCTEGQLGSCFCFAVQSSSDGDKSPNLISFDTKRRKWFRSDYLSSGGRGGQLLHREHLPGSLLDHLPGLLKCPAHRCGFICSLSKAEVKSLFNDDGGYSGYSPLGSHGPGVVTRVDWLDEIGNEVSREPGQGEPSVANHRGEDDGSGYKA